MASVFYAWVFTLIYAVKSNSTGLYHQHLCSGLLQVFAVCVVSRRVYGIRVLCLGFYTDMRYEK